MRKWEDIIKDKMEEPDGTLPESVFAEFRARRDAAAAASVPKRFPLVWAVIPAAAAGLASVLLLRQPAVPEGDVQMIQRPSAPVAVVMDSTTVDEPVQAEPFLARAAMPKAEPLSVAKPLEAILVENADPVEPGVADRGEMGPSSSPAQDTADTEPAEETVVHEHDMATTSPFIPERKGVRKVGMKVLPAAGAIAGGGLLAAVASPLLGAGSSADVAPIYQRDPGSIILDPDSQKEEHIGDVTHYFPLKLGFSMRFPIRERISITTGLDYSWYKSSFTYALSGEKIQNAHYLGIPVRLDWTLSSNKWVDVYLGAGLEGNWCLGATLDGKRISKDGFSASLQGAGGIQFKPMKRVGLYLEPQINWIFASNNNVLETYRTENSLMFSIAAGLRFTIGQ